MSDLNWQVARVVDARPGRARLAFERPEFCSACAQGKGCGAGIFSALFPWRPTDIEIECHPAPDPGEWVRVGFSRRLLVGAALLGYGLPLLAFVLGTLPGHWLVESPGLSDLLALAGGLLAAALVFVLVRGLSLYTTRPIVQALSCAAQDTRFQASES